MNVPRKPFASYKWRWLSVAPSEGLLKAPVFLGVLRALKRNEGQNFSSKALHESLKKVKIDTGTDIDLARTRERNLFRNSGQYWKGTGLLAPVSGRIKLTGIGNKVASGEITNDEFASLMIRNTVLPNPQTYNDAELKKWRETGLKIKPLELIIAVMDKLGVIYGIDQAFLTPNELIKVLIPLSGEMASVNMCADAIFRVRSGILNVDDWPDCAPMANDKRLAREFLLFLENFEICQVQNATNRYDTKYFLDEVLTQEITSDPNRSFLEDLSIIDEELSISRESEISLVIERKRVATTILRRASQSKFRKDVLRSSLSTCILTKEQLHDVLEAAHIIPVGHGGSDTTGNGFCMRVDIHRLYDKGKIRIKPDGNVSYSEGVEAAVSYRILPSNIEIPTFVNPRNIKWRNQYL
ncbi:HNH endonuclease [Amylibacter sp.]|nr:HNH endonuclease [Amylibacter sp.]